MAERTGGWRFRARFGKGAYSWRGSAAAARSLQEAVEEIQEAARTDPAHAAEGAIVLFGRIWTAFQNIDTSSGALPGAVYWAQEALIPLIAAAPADTVTRSRWLEKLWTSVMEDGVDYLEPVASRWGEICASPEAASRWADRLLPGALRDMKGDGYFRGTPACLSSLLASERYKELLELLQRDSAPDWHNRQFGVRALLAQGRAEEALKYAEGSRGLNQPGQAIDRVCERILLDLGRREEAYQRYALNVDREGTGVSKFKALRREYPEIDPRRILEDLADRSGEPGRWFAAAKGAGFRDLALKFARNGRTDPRTLSRAARDFADKDPSFAMAAGEIALERMLDGFAYELTAEELTGTWEFTLRAASAAGCAAELKERIGKRLRPEGSRGASLDDALRSSIEGRPVESFVRKRVKIRR